jgi:hypothetical protein
MDGERQRVVPLVRPVARLDAAVEQQPAVNVLQHVLGHVVLPGFGEVVVEEAEPRDDLVADLCLLLGLELDGLGDLAVDAGVLADHVDALPPGAEVHRARQRLAERGRERLGGQQVRPGHRQRGFVGSGVERGHRCLRTNFPLRGESTTGFTGFNG